MTYASSFVLSDNFICRTTAATNMNDTSSRSHAIFTLSYTQVRSWLKFTAILMSCFIRFVIVFSRFCSVHLEVYSSFLSKG